MEPPQSQPVPQTTTAPPPSHYSDSANSSPRSRSNETWDNTAVGAEHLALPSKLRLMCSYGGHIVPRPHDKSLCYVGGETRIVVVDRHISSLSSLTAHLSKSLLNNSSFTLKYQLPNEDLDSLITVSTDEDLENMIDEHDRALSNPSLKQSRLRLFLFPLKLESAQSNIGPILDSSTKSDDWFLTALNRGFSDSAPVNSLLNLDDDITPSQGNSADSSGCTRDEKGARQDVHSVPDSPMLDTTSSFGSTSSSPSIMNVPSIQMRVEESCGQKLGIEDQFANMVMATGDGQKNDGNLLVLASQPPPLPSALPIPSSGVVTSVEFGNRAVSDDERSDHGVPIAYRRMVQVQQQQPQNQAAMQSQQKSTGVLDLTSPDSVSSDNSFTSAVSCPKPAMYQDQVVQVSPALNMNMVQNNPLDPNTMQIQQQQHMGEAAGYVMQTQVVNHRQPQQQPQQQQYIQSGTPQYVHQHHPVTAYYSVYPPQQQHHLQNHPQLDQQQYPFYYMPVAQPQTQHYNLTDSSQTQNYHHSQAPPSSATMVHQPPTSYNNPMVRTSAASSGKPEMYRVATAGGGGLPQLVQMPPSSQQQQFVGYSQLHHHPSQSTAPTAGATYGYDYANAAAAPSQMYYMQQQTMPSQYQTLAAGLVLPESSNQLPTETVKQQQNRTSQPL